MRLAGSGQVIYAARIFRSTLMVNCTPVVVLGKKFFHLPISLFGTYTEFEIFLRDGIPILDERSV